MDRRFDEGPAMCVLCGTDSLRRGRFLAAFPDRQGDIAAFPLNARPRVPCWRMTECGNCHAVSPLPYPSPEEIARYYRDKVWSGDWDDQTDWEVTHFVRMDRNLKQLKGTKAQADRLRRLRPRPGRLLEVGCAAGWVLKAVRDHGWEVKGIEAAPKFSSFARDRLHLDIFEGLISDVDPATWPKFDVVALFDTFEHLHDPLSDLTTLRQLATDDARLVITTPNIASLVARFWGLRWRQILPSHINYSTPMGISMLLQRCGWEVEHLSEPRYWDPDRRRELRNHVVEVAKFLGRWVCYLGVVKPSKHITQMRRLPPLLTAGRMSWNDFCYRAGFQPVLGDVMLVVARPVR